VSAAADLTRRIEVIEAGYEYLLAYAAQGRQDDTGSEVRVRLTAMKEALHGLGPLVAQRAGESSAAASMNAAAFLSAVDTDAHVAEGAISFVLSRPAISSLLIDNLNASIHVRALLTDLFLVDQALRTDARS
jgi:hypothetical protein